MADRHATIDHGTTCRARMIQTDETDDTFHHLRDMNGHESKVSEGSPCSRSWGAAPFIERLDTSRYVGVIVGATAHRNTMQ